ncbi:M23 family metallopeptidase [Veillonella criceti]|uniref:Murein hydrolase activator NlpD n=1 Tax=Veillonella criceti TaxID=103891 RepID=A0A380NLE7_9FIRM|nr:M23 family metallopeptidase [Veillonella criceti]SUP43966.1 Murein hydrolase activator NlpD precursor [Veillonella criceti]
MKIPDFLAQQVQSQGDSYTLQMTKKQLRLVVGIIVAIIVVTLIFGIWGITRQAEVMQLRQQTQLQTEQLKLLQQKTEILDKKMESLDQLDKEIRQMVKGSESGTIPQGGGEAQTPTANTDKEEPGGVNKAQTNASATSVTSLSAKLSRLDRLAQQRMASFYMLRNILRDGAGQNIRDLQSVAFASNNPGSSTTMPSIWPTKGVITSNFGGRVDPVYGGSASHEGLDIANDYGTPIIATAAGTVTFAGSTSGGYGNLVEIDHGNGFVTRYGHTSVVLVHEGMQVKQGDTVALMGSTGKSTGSHLHYEVNINGVAVDPMLFLPIQ